MGLGKEESLAGSEGGGVDSRRETSQHPLMAGSISRAVFLKLWAMNKNYVGCLFKMHVRPNSWALCFRDIG